MFDERSRSDLGCHGKDVEARFLLHLFCVYAWILRSLGVHWRGGKEMMEEWRSGVTSQWEDHSPHVSREKVVSDDRETSGRALMSSEADGSQG